jgi:predicted nucleic acid-binding protein
VAHLVDTSVLGRLANTTDPKYAVAANAVRELRRRGGDVYVTAQCLVEFRAMATRPLAVNGLGMAAADVEAMATDFEAEFPQLPETPAIYPAWKALVQALGVVGKQVHDARLVAVCHAHAVTHLLTFNVGHFNRLVGFGPRVTVVDPATV